MKHTLTLVLALAVLVAGATIGLAQSSQWQVNDRALVKWSGDEYWYPATITEVDGSRYHVAFDDGDEEWADAARIAGENLTAGSRVFGNWQRRGIYYPGKITDRRGDAITILYDDGDRETTTIAVVRVKR
jgi:hypothetical protein